MQDLTLSPFRGVRLHDLFTKCFDMKLDGGFHVIQCLLIGITLTDNHPLHTERIRYIPIRMFLNDYLVLFLFHAGASRTLPYRRIR